MYQTYPNINFKSFAHMARLYIAYLRLGCPVKSVHGPMQTVHLHPF